jgi:beta-lactamase regulating signal transducer with metallopeptidase domain
MISMLIEAALRALVVALTVWTGLRLCRVGNVLAQKIAWGLVLACAVAMPQLMRWQVLPSSLTVHIPATSWPMTPKSSPVPTVVALSAPAAELPLASPTTPRSKTSASPEPEPRATNFIPEHGLAARHFVPTPHARPQKVQPAHAQLQATPIPAKQASPTDVTPSPSPELLATLLYLAVCAVLLIRMLYGLIMAIRLWLAASPYEADLGRNPDQNPALGLHLRFSFAISSPVTIGSGVLLPADCLNWDREKLRIVLAHERAHVRQGDFYLQLMAALYTTAFWFSPLGWWLKRTLSDLGEAISDRAGLNEAASRASYAQVLLEFAALPRPTVLGVAMARTSNLSHRIERFLDESRFRQAFAGSRRRMVLVVLLVPIALFAGTAMVRVEAAAYSQPVSAQAVLGQSAPTLPAPAAPVPAAAPNQTEPGAPSDPAMAPAPADLAAPAPPSSTANPAIVPAMPTPPEPPDSDDAVLISNGHTMTITHDNTITNNMSNGQSTSVGKGYAYSYSSGGDSWALVTDPSDKVKFSGDWHDSTRESIDRVRKLTNGKFLWFTHEGKSYFIDDQPILAQIQVMYAPMEALGKQQEMLGRQQEELGKQQEKLGRQQESVSISTPDISKEMAELNAATVKLQAKAGTTVSQEELSEVEAKLAEVQGKLGALQGELGDRQGKFGELQGKLGEQQGKLGEEQGRLGEKQGKLAEEADRKVHSIIDESLRDGKARPVQ